MKKKKKYELSTEVSKDVNSDSFSYSDNNVLKKTNYKFWKSVAIIVSIIMTLFVVSCIVQLYQFAYSFHPYAGYATVALLFLILFIFVIRPIVVALATPSFTLDVVDVESARKVTAKNYRSLKKVATNLIGADYVSDEAKEKIKNVMNNRKLLNKVLKEVYDKEISNRINKIINETSSKILLTTAISQNSRFDTMTVITMNIRMIMRIVITCGYHPTYPRLAKLIIKVFRNAVIAYTLQSIGLDRLISQGIQALSKGIIPFIGDLIGKVAGSVIDGSANALLTLRIGILTRKYLYKEFDIQAMIKNPDEANEIILKEAIIEANNDIDDIVEECKKEKKVA
jgi:uncharacterized membrane protein YcjF (UPF0283 family)